MAEKLDPHKKKSFRNESVFADTQNEYKKNLLFYGKLMQRNNYFGRKKYRGDIVE